MKTKLPNPDEGKFFLFCALCRKWQEVQRKEAKFLGVWTCKKCKTPEAPDCT